MGGFQSGICPIELNLLPQGPDRFHFPVLQPLPAPEHHRERQFSPDAQVGS